MASNQHLEQKIFTKKQQFDYLICLFHHCIAANPHKINLRENGGTKNEKSQRGMLPEKKKDAITHQLF